MTSLCKICNSANAGRFETGPCAICNNKLDKLDGLIEKAAAMLNEMNCGYFAISTKMSESWLRHEERIWDDSFVKSETVKGTVNRLVVAKLVKATGKKYDAENGECRAVIDFDISKVSVENAALFVFGRYKKFSRELSQSRWTCKKCDGDGCFKCDYTGKNYTSVEELIGVHFKDAADADDYVLHASGREDVDVVNTAGRPFVLELTNPKNRKIDLIEIANKANVKDIEISDLRLVGRGAVELVANSHFDKAYEAVIEFEKEIGEKELNAIAALSGKTIEQRTPTRVAHRRADLIRKRKILNIGIIEHKDKNVRMRIEAEAGTYIKELISGDKEKTKPSISEIAGTKAKCIELKVVAIYDDFLKIRGL